MNQSSVQKILELLRQDGDSALALQLFDLYLPSPSSANQNRNGGNAAEVDPPNICTAVAPFIYSEAIVCMSNLDQFDRITDLLTYELPKRQKVLPTRLQVLLGMMALRKGQRWAEALKVFEVNRDLHLKNTHLALSRNPQRRGIVKSVKRKVTKFVGEQNARMGSNNQEKAPKNSETYSSLFASDEESEGSSNEMEDDARNVSSDHELLLSIDRKLASSLQRSADNLHQEDLNGHFAGRVALACCAKGRFGIIS